MKFQFKTQDYQTVAVDAVIKCFAGQPFNGGISYRLARLKKPCKKPKRR